jgi:hypothetical protein
MGYLVALTGLVALPYGEELWRCMRAQNMLTPT